MTKQSKGQSVLRCLYNFDSSDVRKAEAIFDDLDSDDRFIRPVCEKPVLFEANNRAFLLNLRISRERQVSKRISTQ